MKLLKVSIIAGVILGFGSTILAEDATKMMNPQFGTKEDIAFAKDMWQKLSKKGFLGVHNHLYIGGPPHGKVREVVEGVIDNNLVILKTNYGGKNISIEKVKKNPNKYLKAITVMVKRKGYDPEDKDWFWIKYAPNGKIVENKKGIKLAGKVAKGMPIGCIACHKSASGDDFVFSHNKVVNASVTWIGNKNLKDKFATLMK